MYAVLSSGGKQYRVEPGSTLTIEKLTEEAGASVTFDRVLLIADGDSVTVGTPTVAGASISATVLGEELGPKIVVFKFKQKAKYRRRTGHRQHLTRVRIDEINADGRSSRRSTEKPKADAASEAPVAEQKAEAAAEAPAAEKPRARRTSTSAKGAEAKASAAPAKASGSKAAADKPAATKAAAKKAPAEKKPAEKKPAARRAAKPKE